MIVVQERLLQAFNTLPSLGAYDEAPEGFKPVYKWGNEAHLIKQIIASKGDMYPLIYQTSNVTRQFANGKYVETDLVLILAVPNKSQEELNEVRWANSFANILNPLATNIETLFKKGSIFVWNGEYTLTEFPNYGNESSTANSTIDIWDALRFETTIKIYNNTVCFKPIKYT